MGSRSLDDLEPGTRAKVVLWLEVCASKAYHVGIVSTYRSFAEQDALYAQGRTAPGPKVTMAKGGQSWHNVRRALDFVVYLDGKPSEDPDVYRQVGKVGEAVGLEWGGRWVSFPDNDHLQNREADDGEVYAHATDFTEAGTVRTGTA